jgi:hypothetical protein
MISSEEKAKSIIYSLDAKIRELDKRRKLHFAQQEEWKKEAAVQSYLQRIAAQTKERTQWNQEITKYKASIQNIMKHYSDMKCVRCPSGAVYQWKFVPPAKPKKTVVPIQQEKPPEDKEVLPSAVASPPPPPNETPKSESIVVKVKFFPDENVWFASLVSFLMKHKCFASACQSEEQQRLYAQRFANAFLQEVREDAQRPVEKFRMQGPKKSAMDKEDVAMQDALPAFASLSLMSD